MKSVKSIKFDIKNNDVFEYSLGNDLKGKNKKSSSKYIVHTQSAKVDGECC